MPPLKKVQQVSASLSRHFKWFSFFKKLLTSPHYVPKAGSVISAKHESLRRAINTFMTADHERMLQPFAAIRSPFHGRASFNCIFTLPLWHAWHSNWLNVVMLHSTSNQITLFHTYLGYAKICFFFYY